MVSLGSAAKTVGIFLRNPEGFRWVQLPKLLE